MADSRLYVHVLLDRSGSMESCRDKTIDAFNDAGKTVSVLLVDGVPAGLIAMRDEPRADAKAGLAALKDHGVRTIMLTGDNKRTAEAIAIAPSVFRGVFSGTSCDARHRERRRYP